MLSRSKHIIGHYGKAFIVLAALLVCCNPAMADRQNKLDSLLNLLKKDKQDTIKAGHLNNICDAYYSTGNPNMQLQYADSLMKLSQKLGYKTGIGEAYQNMGDAHLNKGDFDIAMDYEHKALDIFKALGNKHGIAAVLGNMGNIYEQKGDFDKALEYFSSALEMNQELGSKLEAATDNNNIGIVYAEEGDNTKALDYFLRALKIDRELGDKNNIAMAVGNVGIIYDREGEYQKSLDSYLEALKLNEELGNKSGIATNKGNIGTIYNHLKDYKKALEYMNDALAIAEEMGNTYLQMNNLTNIGDTYKFINAKDTTYMGYYYKALKIAVTTGNKDLQAKIMTIIGESYSGLKLYKNALRYLNRAVDISSAIGDEQTLQEGYSTISDVYAAMQDWQNAYKTYSKASDLEDSLNSQQKTKEIGRLEAKADFDKQLALQKANQEKQSALALEESKRQRILIYFITAIALAVAIIAIIIFRSLKTARTQKKLIEMQKMAVEQQKLLVEEKNTEIVDSINYAKRLQDAILPPLEEVNQALPDSFVLYKPKDIVAGDFYWIAHPQPFPAGREKKVLPTGEDSGGATTLIAAADCTGHGVPGALVSVVCSNALNRAVKEFGITDTGKILDKVRELVLETFEKSSSDVKDGMDISLCSLSHSQGRTTIQWSGANRPLWYITDGKLQEIVPDKQPIGKMDNPKPFTTHSFHLKKGDIIYLFTDGFADQFGGPKGKKFKYKQLQEVLLNTANGNMQQQKQQLQNAFAEWMGMLNQVDDVLVIGIRV